MSDRSTNQVLSRRLGALSIDVGTVVCITGLAAWAQAEKFIPDRVESDSGNTIWSTVDQVRRDDIAQDSWNRMQKVGNTEYVWTRNSLLTVGLVGLGAAALVFLLIPAIVRSTIGKKLFRIRSKKKPTDTGIDGGQLDRRRSAKDPESAVIDLDDRLSKTNVGSSVDPSPIEGSDFEPEQPTQANELFQNDADKATNSVPHVVDLGHAQIESPDDLLPIDVLPLDASGGITATGTLTSATPGGIDSLARQPIDVEAGGLLGMEVSSDLPASWPNELTDLDDTDPGGADLPVETTDHELPDLGFRDPVHSTLSEPAPVDNDDKESQPLPPPPLHRAVKWDPPTAEPAPVWSPETEQPLDADADLPTDSDPLIDDSTEVSQGAVSDMSTQTIATVDKEPPVSTTPSWNEDWQAWIYWDQTHAQWLRHDVEADVWVPLS